ncbi:MAG: GNAT family N-acetyltransferase [Bacteroidales bacterium]|jgi:ribosomal protein S18 acetylase RimI-like enzyme|nr:GNAT family N-acetyltransferase [Bacteroidales bacterium]
MIIPYKQSVVNTITNSYFPNLWKIYETAFPWSERRDLDSQNRIFTNPNYFLEIWTDKDMVLGFIGWWKCIDLLYVEHFAIHPNYRSQGYGQLFLSEWIAKKKMPIILEIEPVMDKLTLRRQKFYHRLGFKTNNIVHVQPPYHKDTEALNLWLMSYPHLILKNQYAVLKNQQLTEIIGNL